MPEEVILKNRGKLLLETIEIEDSLEVSFQLETMDNCVLHWGLLRSPHGAWQIPPEPVRPEGSRPFDSTSVQTPFVHEKGQGRVLIRLGKEFDYTALVFVLFFPDKGLWENNLGNNYRIALPVKKKQSLLPAVMKEEAAGKNILFQDTFPLGDNSTLSAAVIRSDHHYQVILLCDVPGPVILHWGAALQSRYEWVLPPAVMQPSGSIVCDSKAVQTPFILDKGINRLNFLFRENEAPLGITFVVKITDGNIWVKNGKRDFFIPVTCAEEEKGGEVYGLAEEIVSGETGNHGWSLMHRFNLCHDLMEGARKNAEGLAILYVWMRFSAIRQLDWQRNFNTKPKELSHAQDRLTLRIADAYKSQAEGRDLLRMIMSTLGRGGEGQRIRDEILHIMHRHHIKEVSGHFMEEWHQKLHNNTTPDDIVICHAYIQFLRSNGNLDLFYETLSSGGVSRERMEGFERPITTEPDFVPYLKDALIYDFENYLKLLKSIHSGTDLESAINAARYLLDAEAGELLAVIWSQRDTGGAGITDYIRKITRARIILKERLNKEGDNGSIRDMLFLDLALEDFIRIVIERSIHQKLDGNQLVELTDMVLENIRFSYDNDELSESNKDWKHLMGLPRFSKDWALHANAVLERVGRSTGAFVDRYYQLLQSKAEYLGRAFRADSWAISLFSEEVIRGMPAFVLSMLVRHLEPLLRRHAKLGDWQVISPGRTAGWLEVADSLGAVKGRRFERPSIILADRVRGDEEPPEGATAIITPDAVDLVSHVAVRARNAHLLFATCYDRDCFDRLKSLKGHMLNLRVNVSGDVEYEEADTIAEASPSYAKFKYEKRALPEFSAYTVSSSEFNSGLVGGKSNNLKRLENALPEWIHLPVSTALPFGIFDKALELDANKAITDKYRILLGRVERNTEEILSEIRRLILALHAPEALASSLRAVLDSAGFQWPGKWDSIWKCIKRVWASKWNERAYYSRNTWQIKHEDIFMAVLIQQVVDAEYAFVVHTVNPFTEDKNELYAEVVPGLGETLVGNYPGRALSFISNKSTAEHNIISYPSKSTGLFGGGLIFRSDSNAEDLPGYAGAGLYDSIMLEPPREMTLNYTQDRLTWDDAFKKEFMTAVTEIGALVEDRFGFPQDIEGVYSKGKYYVVQTRPQVGISAK